MNNKQINGTLLWKQFEDILAPALRLTHMDRAVYSHLIRHTLLEGQRRLRFSIPWLARGSRVTYTSARDALHRLADRGALRLVERSRLGHEIEMRHPHEIRRAVEVLGAAEPRDEQGIHRATRRKMPSNFEEIDFMRTKQLRESIYTRDRGLCFYCLCRLKLRTRCIDHVVPRWRSGRNSYRNLVAACMDCNSQKSAGSARAFLRRLHRAGRLTAPEFTARLAALRSLAAGKLRPVLPTVQERNSHSGLRM